MFGKTLSGKVALITGSSKGIGKAIATQLAKEGATIILHYFMDELSTLKLKKDLQKEYDVSVYAVQANLAYENEIKKLFIKISILLIKLIFL